MDDVSCTISVKSIVKNCLLNLLVGFHQDNRDIVKLNITKLCVTSVQTSRKLSYAYKFILIILTSLKFSSGFGAHHQITLRIAKVIPWSSFFGRKSKEKSQFI